MPYSRKQRSPSIETKAIFPGCFYYKPATPSTAPVFQEAAVKKNEISSTEKLLNLIKDQDQHNATPSAQRPASPPGKSPQKKKPLLARLSHLKGVITVGADIGPTEIRLSKIAHYSENNRQLHDIQTIPLDPTLPRTSPDFHKFIGRTLNDFCGADKKVKIWTTISSLNVEVRLLSLPVVPKEMLANSARLTFQKEVPFDGKEMVFDYIYQGETIESDVKKMSILAFIAPRKEVNDVRALFARSGYPLTGITVISFALQNLYRVGNISSDRKPECYLFIGSDWSRIDLYDRGVLTMIRDIKTGMNSMVEDIMDGINSEIQEKKESITLQDETESTSSESEFLKSNLDGEEVTAYTAPTDSAFVLDLESPADKPDKGDARAEEEGFKPEEIGTDEAAKILKSQLENGPTLSEDDPGYNASSENIFDFIKPSVDRLVRQIERTISHYTSTFQGKHPTQLYFTGSLGTYEKLVAYTENHLGITSSCLDPFAFTNRNLIEMPVSLAKRQAYAPTVGLGLSDLDRTPNFLFTQEDKGYMERLARKDRIIFAVFLGIIVSCLGGYAWQNLTLHKKREELTALKQELSSYQPETDKEFLMEMAAGIRQRQKTWKRYQQRYRPIALISELSSLTPSEISYQSCNIMMRQPSGNKDAERQMVLNGRLQGSLRLLESSLSGFLVKLTNSPLFGRPKIENSAIEANRKTDDKGTLNFQIRLNLDPVIS